MAGEGGVIGEIQIQRRNAALLVQAGNSYD